MPRVNYIGPTPSDPDDVATRLQTQTKLSSGPVNRTDVSSYVHDTIVNDYATKIYVDQQDNLYALDSYFADGDALNVPTSTKGQPNGAATLDSGGKIPSVQIPTLGAGYVKGPFGPTTVLSVSGVQSTPVKVATFALGVQSVSFRPLVFVSARVNSDANARPVLEARISDGDAAYGSQELVARGAGRFLFDESVVAVVPAGPNGSTSGTYAASTDIVINLWLYNAQAGTCRVDANAISSAGVYLWRTQQ